MGFGAGLGLVIKLKAQLSKPIALKDVKEIQDKDNKKANKDGLDKPEDDPYKENCGDVNAWCETAVTKPLEILFLMPSCTSPKARKEHKIHARKSMPCLLKFPIPTLRYRFFHKLLYNITQNVHLTSPPEMFISKKKHGRGTTTFTP